MLFGTTPATFVGHDRLGLTLTVTAPAGTGTVQVTVVTLNGTSIGLPYTYTTPPGPTVTGIFPTSGGASAGGTPFVIYGSNLNTATGVTFGTAAATNLLVAPSGNFIIGLTPAGTPSTNVPVTVTFPAPTPPATVTGGYTYGA